MKKIGRNDPCPCGSGKKYKKCCQGKFNVQDVVGKAAEYINQGRLDEAELILTEALGELDDTVLCNNLAGVLMEKGEPGRCLEVLEPCLDPDRMDMLANPYTFALAARAHAALGKREEAYQYLTAAEHMFEDGLRILLKDKTVEAEEELHAWREYTVILMKAAADLEDHQRVLDIYNRWEAEHVNWENHFMAGAAYFNLKQFRSAASIWGKSAAEWRMAAQFQNVSLLVEEGTIPFFHLNYKLKKWNEVEKMILKIHEDEAYLTEAMRDSGFFLVLLSLTFQSGAIEDFNMELLRKMVCRGEAWGEELGKGVLKSPTVSPDYKIAAAKGLIEKGVYRPDEPIPMFIEGEERAIELKEYSVADEPEQETLDAMQKADVLQEEGKLEEAITVLKEALQNKNFFPPAAVYLSALLRSVKRLEEAEGYLRMAELTAPQEPLVLFNLAGLLWEQGRAEQAEQYLERIDLEEANKEIREKTEALKMIIAIESLKDGLSEDWEIRERYEEEQRRKIEEKPLPLEANLSRCLKNMPAGWLTGMCTSLKIKSPPRRSERQKQVQEALLETNNLRMLLKEYAEPEDLELLRYLLENGGWARLNAVTRKFGSLKGDGFFWEDELPASSVGMLWALGLVAVGRAKVGKKREKIVTIPLELRRPLAELLEREHQTAENMTDWDYHPEGSSSWEMEGSALVFRVNITDRYARVRGYPYRVLAVPGDYTLYQFAAAIVDAFDFDFDHAFGFYDNLKDWTRSREGYELFADLHEADEFPGVMETPLTEVFPKPGKKMLFLFDYGDEWRFLVRLQKEIDMRLGEEYPQVLQGEGEIEQY